MNRYKIDCNPHATDKYPLALFVKRDKWFASWEFVTSLETKEDGIELHNKLADFPIYLSR